MLWCFYLMITLRITPSSQTGQKGGARLGTPLLVPQSE